MKKIAIGKALVLGVLVIPLAGADEDFDALQKEFQQASQDWGAKLDEFKGEDGNIDWSRAPKHPTADFAPRFKAYADENLEQGAALSALCWLTNRAGSEKIGDSDQPVGKWALEVLGRHHAGDAAIAKELPRLRYASYTVGSEPLIAFFKKVIAENNEQDAKAWSTFNLGYLHYQDGRRAAGEEASAGTKLGLKLFRKTAEEFDGTKAAERAVGFIYETENLQIGMTAPEIVGTDVDGSEIKLSQFRGQVVVLDFWGFW